MPSDSPTPIALPHTRRAPSQDEDTSFLDAVKKGNMQIVTTLGDPHRVTKASEDGRQPIHWACAAGKLNVAQWLEQKGAKLTEPTKGGWYTKP